MLEHLPLFFIIAGLAAYAVLAGADFGAGIWSLVSKRENQKIRDHARHSMGPVWEANHVWLIFIIVVAWTAYPRALSSIASTLAVPLALALIGIVFRGTAYALRPLADETGGAGMIERVFGPLWIERVFGISSVLTPFALGAVAGAIASGRVPVGNAAGNLITSWANATGITIGLLSVATSWYLASVYLSADAQRTGDADLVEEFRNRALGTGGLAGLLSVVGLIVVHADDHRIWHGLTTGGGLVALVISILAGAITIGFVLQRRYGLARMGSALAVAAVISGWAVAQRPYLLPGLTIPQAAAGHETLVALAIAVPVGALVLIPSLWYLFSLTLQGTLDHDQEALDATLVPEPELVHFRTRVVAAVASLVLGAVFTVFLSSWGQALGVVLLLAFIILGFSPLARPAGDGETDAPPAGEHG